MAKIIPFSPVKVGAESGWVKRRSMIEIERKFLVEPTANLNLSGGVKIRQGYLSRDPERTVRVRVIGEGPLDQDAYLTIKGKTEKISRVEVETLITPSQAAALMPLCLSPIVEKTRYAVGVGEKLWSVDVFSGPQAGLILAEVELDDPDEVITIPEWAGKEVSEDPAYFNSNLGTT